MRSAIKYNHDDVFIFYFLSQEFAVTSYEITKLKFHIVAY